MEDVTKKIKLIIFDAYGVVIKGGFPPTCQYLAKRFHLPYKKVFAVVYTKWFNMAAERKIMQEQAWRGAIKELGISITWRELHNRHMAQMKLNLPVIRLAKKIRKDYKTLILSKNTKMQWRDGVAKLSAPHYFDSSINTQNLGLPKASPKTLHYLMKRFNVKKEEIIYIDDQENNLTSARQLGIKVIYYKSFSQFKRELIKLIN